MTIEIENTMYTEIEFPKAMLHVASDSVYWFVNETKAGNKMTGTGSQTIQYVPENLEDVNAVITIDQVKVQLNNLPE